MKPPHRHPRGHTTSSTSLHWGTRGSKAIQHPSLRSAPLKAVVPAQTTNKRLLLIVREHMETPRGCSPSRKFRRFSKPTPRLPRVSGGLLATPECSEEDTFLGEPLSSASSPSVEEMIASKVPFVPLTLAENHQPRGIGKGKRKGETSFTDAPSPTPMTFAKALCRGQV